MKKIKCFCKEQWDALLDKDHRARLCLVGGAVVFLLSWLGINQFSIKQTETNKAEIIGGTFIPTDPTQEAASAIHIKGHNNPKISNSTLVGNGTLVKLEESPRADVRNAQRISSNVQSLNSSAPLVEAADSDGSEIRNVHTDTGQAVKITSSPNSKIENITRGN